MAPRRSARQVAHLRGELEAPSKNSAELVATGTLLPSPSSRLTCCLGYMSGATSRPSSAPWSYAGSNGPAVECSLVICREQRAGRRVLSEPRRAAVGHLRGELEAQRRKSTGGLRERDAVESIKRETAAGDEWRRGRSQAKGKAGRSRKAPRPRGEGKGGSPGSCKNGRPAPLPRRKIGRAHV